MTPILSVRNLHIKYHTQGTLLHAVRGSDFDLYSQETVGIVGESGSGKSSIAKALLKLTPSHTTLLQGEVNYAGENLILYSEKQMQAIRGKEIGMIFQDPMTSLNPTISIGKQITEGIFRHFPSTSSSKAKEIAIEMLKSVGIQDPHECFNTYPHRLSGGMCQRIIIAIALALQPKILIADEPTTALDVTIQMQILNLLQELQQKTKTSILLITHSLSVVAKMCDRVLVVYGGKIVESASVDALFYSPQHPYTKRLLQAIPRLDQDKTAPLIPIEGTPPNLSHSIPGCSFCPRCPEAMQICASSPPPLFQVGGDTKKHEHLSACFNHDPRKKENT